jgi:hypothetical protein
MHIFQTKRSFPFSTHLYPPFIRKLRWIMVITVTLHLAHFQTILPHIRHPDGSRDPAVTRMTPEFPILLMIAGSRLSPGCIEGMRCYRNFGNV